MKILRTFCSVVEADVEGHGTIITNEIQQALNKASEDELIEVVNTLELLADVVHLMIKHKREGVL